VDGADVVNLIGDWMIVGEVGTLTTVTPIRAHELEERIARGLEDVWRGWKTFAPRPPLTAGDTYAHAAAVVWEALDRYCRASFPPGADLGDARALIAELDRWRPGTVPPVDSHEDLVQLCRFVLFQVTFLHAWVNDAQWDDGGDPDHSPMAVRALPQPGLSYEAWRPLAAPSRMDAGQQKLVANALSRFDVGLALRDDLHPPAPKRFRDMVESLGAPFRTGGPDRRLDKGWFRSRLNS
jgi:hypothetical protein